MGLRNSEHACESKQEEELMLTPTVDPEDNLPARTSVALTSTLVNGSRLIMSIELTLRTTKAESDLSEVSAITGRSPSARCLALLKYLASGFKNYVSGSVSMRSWFEVHIALIDENGWALKHLIKRSPSLCTLRGKWTKGLFWTGQCPRILIYLTGEAAP